VDAFDQEVERRIGSAAKADVIANRLAKTINERMDEDPVFFRKFADLVQKAIDDYRNDRISDAEYLRKVSDYMGTIRRGHDTELPRELADYREAPAYYGVVGEVLENYGPDGAARRQIAAQMAIAIEKILDPMKGRDWTVRDDIQKGMANAIDDFLFEARDRYGVTLNTPDMDAIIERCLSIAKKLAGG
jgi:type I restriction enzyme, R subunit